MNFTFAQCNLKIILSAAENKKGDRIECNLNQKNLREHRVDTGAPLTIKYILFMAAALTIISGVCRKG